MPGASGVRVSSKGEVGAWIAGGVKTIGRDSDFAVKGWADYRDQVKIRCFSGIKNNWSLSNMAGFLKSPSQSFRHSDSCTYSESDREA